MSIRSRIVGCGSWLPERVMTNAELSTIVDTTDEWIVERTGIRQRHIAADGEYTSDIAYKAALDALKHAGAEVSDIDMIVLATTTPDQTFPSTATKVQAMLGMEKGAAFDVQAVCSGFIYALAVGDNFIRTGQAEKVLVIGAEIFSRILDWEDRGTCVLFGDGGAAVLLDRAIDDTSVILSTHLHSDGRYNDLLYVDGGPSTTGTVGNIRMSGKEVFRHAVVNLAAVADEALAANNLSRDDIDWLVPHQANLRILSGTARKLKLGEDRVVITVDRHANTSAASIPLALDVAVKDGRIKPGQLILMEAMGGGFTWGSALVRM
ncbi:MAG: ketoacyl-ACP synthase III [Rhodospirillaceae bacterium]|jgi:3-oxoacyl-[acyl-carrier-protein] synthase III|nr:ketoacyl-ACP synthase III [Rhodospirillaceae bacterium]MBT4220495.1 ketoacyl-ACP synthase III [Rhodospirillaceae bacterium]MBT4464113.1 ketoacyl-ACP synthase III [Rhodospirillaceae bacterium]MBT5308038.1 ketoacyl-ACP synthase III [Rhodospirillaceae bacterium]MBT7355644.1 ketoacyl-ACP synthase III [Rhodospirillaceae bacterium]